MTVISATASVTSCSFISRMSSPRKLTRLCWTIIITAFICFWTYFLYCYTGNSDTNLTKTEKYMPIALSQKQQKLFDSLIKTTTNAKPLMKHQHNRAQIEQLLINNNRNEQLVDVTVLLQLTQEDEVQIANIETQINSILSQSIQPKYIWILYNLDSMKKKLQRILKKSSVNMNKTQLKFILFSSDVTPTSSNKLLHVRDASWLLQHTIMPTTSLTWIIEPNKMPDHQYLYYTYGLLNTKEYKSTLIGYETSLLLNDHQQLCLQSSAIKKTEAVDMIHGSWLLATSWIPLLRKEITTDSILDLPLAYFISSSLLYRAEISSIAIPSKLKPASPSSCLVQNTKKFNSVLPNVIDQRRINLQEKNRIVLLLDGAERALELFPLMCRLFDQQTMQVHVILTNGLIETVFQDLANQMQCIDNSNGNVIIHDLSSAYNNGIHQIDMKNIEYVTPIARLLEFIQAQVLIQIKYSQDSYFYCAIQAAAQVQHTTTINLPMGEVEHSLWIADLSIEALQHWNDIKMDLVVITDQRPQSLLRLLESTNNAYYLGDDQVELVIHMEQSADIVTRNLVQAFGWQHGNKKVRHRIRKGGLMPAIVESWYPSDNHNYGVLLEDDIELSPLFYSWSKYNILKYRYTPHEEKAYQHIYGVSLYSPRNLELIPEGRRPFNPEPVLEDSGYPKRTPYATQIPCSWGAVYFPEHWREFHTYLTERIEKEEWKGFYNITVPNSRSERWKKSWKKYFIELVYLRAYVMVYPNFEQFESFSTNHLEYGTHVKTNGRTQSKVEQFLVPLMQRDTIMDQLPSGHLPMFDHLPIMDLWGSIRTLEELNRVGAYWHQEVSTCQRTTGLFDPSDLLCPFPENIEKAQKKQDSKK